MKTNIVMRSTDRELLGVTIRQETATSFLNVTDLQRAYNVAAGLNGWCDKRIDKIIGYDDNIERVYYILKEQVFGENIEGRLRPSMESDNKLQIPMFKELKDYSFPDTFPDFKELVKNYSIVKVLKHFGVYKQVGTREEATIWCNPYIWVLLALELNPMLYGKVVGWLTDSLIFSRIEAGDLYKPLCAHIKELSDNSTDAYCKTAIALNCKVFGEHYKGIRQAGTKEQLHELTELEKKLSWAIDVGLINSMQELWDKI